ncbi:MAG TPA: hypothetical protein VEV84_02330, partial [Pyrinomonadaceae bacterium]|nr:hypothetical protein [Pyrinomonadaceae bacterium]
RIYLRDIRHLATVAEITEELSNLADAIIEFSLRLARQDLENRYGVPLQTDDKGRSSPADFCVLALGKLGSRELNYSSDIDLLFIYSHDGSTSDLGTAGSITNREFFIKLAERVINLAGGQSGEGAAYRVDMRLRPHGSIGRLALSLAETIRYYKTDAREWEQQVLIRSRPIAGDLQIYKDFYAEIEDSIFRPDVDIAQSLANVRLSKRRIEDPIPPGPGYNVKLGRGGIREIEFIAQALQLAYGGRDRWLRHSHTLVSLSRLSDRGLIAEKHLTGLFDAYDFLRRLEHRLQMEHGLQTHTVPKTASAHCLVARRMGFDSSEELNHQIALHSANVQKTFAMVFADETEPAAESSIREQQIETVRTERQQLYDEVASVSPHFAQMLSSTPDFDDQPDTSFDALITDEHEFAKRLSLIRRTWTRSILKIAVSEIEGEISISESKQLQTELAETSIDAALQVMRDEVASRFGVSDLALSVLALGKLGGRGVDYASDLDIVIVYDDDSQENAAEIYNRAVEIFVTTLSGMTRDGNLYRVDLRLRPYGKNGASSSPRSIFVDYFEHTAAVWELLAFVKLRGVTGPIANEVESDVRRIIHRRACETDPEVLRGETVRIRYMLEKQRAGRRDEIDLKYGAGGLLDVYFATRYLQLRDNIPDDAENRSTRFVLDRLLDRASLSADEHRNFAEGHAFLTKLDHNIRLVTGRSRQLPRDPKSLRIITDRTGFADTTTLLETLSTHRLNIRNTFEDVLEIN